LAASGQSPPAAVDPFATFGLGSGKLVGQKTPLRLRDIWAIRVRLQIAERTRDLALFDLAIDSKLRACDLASLMHRKLTVFIYQVDYRPSGLDLD